MEESLFSEAGSTITYDMAGSGWRETDGAIPCIFSGSKSILSWGVSPHALQMYLSDTNGLTSEQTCIGLLLKGAKSWESKVSMFSCQQVNKKSSLFSNWRKCTIFKWAPLTTCTHFSEVDPIFFFGGHSKSFKIQLAVIIAGQCPWQLSSTVQLTVFSSI